MEYTKMGTTIVIAVVIIVIIAVIGGYMLISGPPAAKKLKIALLSAADETDVGWTASAAEALKYARDKYDAELSFSWYVTYADAARVIRDYAARGYDIVFCNGAEYEEPALTVAPDFPNTVFIGYDFSRPDPPTNLLSVFKSDHEGEYITGILGAYLTETKHVGYIMGENYPELGRQGKNIQLALERVDPSIEYFEIAAGTWIDALLGYDLAKSMIETNDVDVMFQAADVTGRGVISACQEKGIYHIGTYWNQSVLAPEITVTSTILDKSKCLDYVISILQKGSFTQGKLITPGLLEGEVYIAPFYGFEDTIPTSVKQEMEDAKEGILDGTISLWQFEAGEWILKPSYPRESFYE